jgi:hypothetical protein
MSYWLDIKGHSDLCIKSESVPRIGETVILSPETFSGQEEELRYKVIDVVYPISGIVLSQESPLVIIK